MWIFWIVVVWIRKFFFLSIFDEVKFEGVWVLCIGEFVCDVKFVIVFVIVKDFIGWFIVFFWFYSRVFFEFCLILCWKFIVKNIVEEMFWWVGIVRKFICCYVERIVFCVVNYIEVMFWDVDFIVGWNVYFCLFFCF